MNLYLIEQTVNSGWDTYSSAVVLAESGDAARRIHPAADDPTLAERLEDSDTHCGWADPSDVTATYLGPFDGMAINRVVVCSSYHSG